MNNFGIILNQDNNQSYLGKFYNRNRLEFPVIRKIYEQIEINKNTETNNTIINNDSVNNKLKDINNLNDQIILEKIEDINTQSDDLIILENKVCESIINNEYCNNELSNATPNITPSHLDKIEIDKLNIAKSSTNIEKKNDYFEFNTKQIIFLWLSSLLIIYSIEYKLFKFELN